MIRAWVSSAAVIALISLPCAATAAKGRSLEPLNLPDDLPIGCLDSKEEVQPMRDASTGDATVGSLEAAWARAGHTAAAYLISDTVGLLRFRDHDPPPDEYAYTVRLRNETLVITALAIHQKGSVQRLSGTDVCIQLFDILHH